MSALDAILRRVQEEHRPHLSMNICAAGSCDWRPTPNLGSPLRDQHAAHVRAEFLAAVRGDAGLREVVLEAIEDAFHPTGRTTWADLARAAIDALTGADS